MHEGELSRQLKKTSPGPDRGFLRFHELPITHLNH